MSFRLKIFLIVLLVPAISLILLLYFLSDNFIKDKTAFVYELHKETLGSIAVQIERLLETKRTRVFEESLAPAEREEAKKLCASGRKLMWHANANDKNFDYWYCAERADGETRLMKIEKDELQAILASQSLISTYLVSPDGLILANDDMKAVGKWMKDIYLDLPAFTNMNMEKGMVARTSRGEQFLMSVTRFSSRPFLLLGMTSRRAPQEASWPFLVKGLGLMIFVLIFVSVAGVLFSHSLTQKVHLLLNTMAEFGAGHEQARIEVKGKDELDQLGRGFNQLADRVNALIVEQREKSKIEHEMSLAAQLQQQFFPPPENDIGPFRIRARIQPAVISGGDWWFLFETRSSIVVGIGDVTGHGMNSTIVTAAGRSALSQIEANYLSPSNLMTVLNRAIFDITKGELQMTAVAIEIFRDGRRLRYCNASHESMALFTGGTASSLSGPKLLNDLHGVRLGESRDSLFMESEVELAPNFQLWLYSDGLPDVLNQAGRKLGDRKLFQIFANCAKCGDVDKAFAQFHEEWNAFRDNTPLPDDSSIVLVEGVNLT
jgi:sigma-B regulation protein RsbU (phosphoserine phosphatase)